MSSRSSKSYYIGIVLVGLVFEKYILNVRGRLRNVLSDSDFIVRRGRSLTLMLTLLSIYLINRSRENDIADDEEKEWVEQELSKRRDRLEGVIKFAADCLSEKEEVDVEVVLEATDEVAQFHKSDPLVREGLLTAAKSVSSNILRMGDLDRRLETEDASSLLAQLEFEKQIFDCAKIWFVDTKELLKVMAESARKAKHIIRRRKTSQIVKTVALLERAKSQFPFVVVSSVLAILYGSIFALKSHYMGKVMTLAFEQIKGGAKKNSRNTIYTTVKDLFMLELLSLLSGFVSDKTKSMGRREFILKLKTELFRSLISQDIAYFEQHDMYHSRQIIGNADFVCQSLFDLPIETIQSVASMTATMAMLFSKSRELSIMLAVLFPLRLFITESLTGLQDRLEASMATPHVSNFRDIWTVLVNPVGVRTLRCFGREPVETSIYSQGLKAQDRAQEVATLFYSVFDIFRTFTERSVEIAGLWYGGNLAANGALDVSDVASFTTSANHAFECARRVYYSFVNFFANNGILDAAEKMYDLLNSKPGIGVDEPPYEEMPPGGADMMEWSVTFRSVSFAYPTRFQVKALEDVSFEIAAGERVGILGESGCGKSTLASLMLRLYDPTEGEVLIGNRPLRDYNPLWLRRRIALVSQTIYLPFRTVKENLMYGLFEDEAGGKAKTKEEVDRELRDALRMAGCEDLFFDKRRFKQLWHTDIGRDASSLSGGERQRLCIARAILTKPSILILDEASSALDEENQYIVQESIQKIYEACNKKLTIITIAHRLSNFRHADKLIVLDKGKVVELGTTKQLVKLENGIFANFVDRSTIDFSA